MKNISSIFVVLQANNFVFLSGEELQKFLPNLMQTFNEFSEEDKIVEIGRLRRHLEVAEICQEVVITEVFGVYFRIGLL